MPNVATLPSYLRTIRLSPVCTSKQLRGHWYASDKALQNAVRQWLQRREIIVVFQRWKTTGDKGGDCIEK